MSASLATVYLVGHGDETGFLGTDGVIASFPDLREALCSGNQVPKIGIYNFRHGSKHERGTGKSHFRSNSKRRVKMSTIKLPAYVEDDNEVDDVNTPVDDHYMMIMYGAHPGHYTYAKTDGVSPSPLIQVLHENIMSMELNSSTKLEFDEYIENVTAWFFSTTSAFYECIYNCSLKIAALGSGQHIAMMQQKEDGVRIENVFLTRGKLDRSRQKKEPLKDLYLPLFRIETLRVSRM
ncbi:hypothetical protein L596_027535 [Steinernema carpocapsae]|uniref:Uncharacterized protein n=1 Tax=Steinernema carpocapsae TaxID=34508 RepID=A0A4U5LVS7_STECR|nr:hypothetical protein L596_027535 [Steinernema carpocapsae]